MKRRCPIASFTRGAIFFAFMAHGCTPSAPIQAKPKAVARTAKSFLGDRMVSILSGAKRVEVFLIEPKPTPSDASRTIQGYPIRLQGKDQGPTFAARLRTILLDDRTYSFDSFKGCIFSPGVVFRFRNGDELVEIITCYKCSEFLIVAKDDRGAVVRVVGEDFDNARPALVKLAKDAFPDDKEIQALNDRG